MLATDKQILYLKNLTDKVRRIISEWPENGMDNDFQQWIQTVDWSHERLLGMTASDASTKISGFRTIIRGINTKRVLLGLRQF